MVFVGLFKGLSSASLPNVSWYTVEWYNVIKKSLIIAVSHPAESGGGPEAEAHCGAEEEPDPGGQRPRGTLPGTLLRLFHSC